MGNKFFNVTIVSVLSLSIIGGMDFENLSGLDAAVIGSTVLMWIVNGAYFLRRLMKNA